MCVRVLVKQRLALLLLDGSVDSGQWTVSVFHGGLESFVCVCLIALLPQAGHRKQWVRRGATECSKGNEQGLK